MSSILIAGCGYVGTALALDLISSGREVYGLRRTKGPANSGIQWLVADLTQVDSIPELPKTISEVIYCAAPNSHDEEAYRQIYVRGFQNLLQAIRESKCTIARYIYVSSTGVYGQNQGEIVDEDSDTIPQTFSGKILLEAEQRVLALSGLRTVVRFSGIYGPQRESLVKQVAQGTAVTYFGAPHYTNRVHLEDCVGILRFLLEQESLESVYVGSDTEAADRATVLQFIAGCLNVPAPRVAPVSEAPPSLREKNKRCSSAKLQALGYQFKVPTFREGFTSLCAEFLRRNTE